MKKNKNVSPTDILPSSNQKVYWKCSKNHSWLAKVENRTFNNRNCPYCTGQLSIQGENDLTTLRPDLAKEWDYEKNGDLIPEMFTLNSNRKVYWKCSKNHSWQSTIINRTRKNFGCPHCNSSHGEKKIENYLKINNIKYIQQFKFKDCINKLPLKFDFAIIDNDRVPITLIEYDGQQHFKETDFSGNTPKDKLQNELNKTQMRDAIKTKYCKDNNIPLIRINYQDFNEIETILNEKIKSI